jgi:hypothetical protein
MGHDLIGGGIADTKTVFPAVMVISEKTVSIPSGGNLLLTIHHYAGLYRLQHACSSVTALM